MDIQDLYFKFLKVGKISTDTRNQLTGTIFFALKGPNFNGNHYVKEAIDKGCEYVVCDQQSSEPRDQRVIVVSNSLLTLQKLALHHRKQFNIPVIGITGSNGKTTTKQLIASVLSQKYKVLSTVGSLNNHLGVPITLLQLSKQHQIAVIEMGISHEGNMKQLLGASQPNYGIITNIGMAHFEDFLSCQNILKEKSQLYEHLRNTDGKVFVNRDDEMLMTATEGIDRILYGQSKDVDSSVSGNILNDEKQLFLRFQWRKNNILQTVQTKLVGTYNLLNCLAAVCVGLFFSLDPESIKLALQNYIPSINRSQYKITDKNHLVVDCYNANPSSMWPSLLNFQKLEISPKMWIIGQMLSAGDYEKEENFKLVDYFKAKQFKEKQMVYFIGLIFVQDKDKSHPRIVYLKSVDDFILSLKNQKIEGYQIFIKGSGAIQLYKLLDFL